MPAVVTASAASAAPNPASTSTAAIAPQSGGCLTVQTTIRLDGRAGTYSLAPDGSLVAGSSLTNAPCPSATAAPSGGLSAAATPVPIGYKTFTPGSPGFSAVDGNGAFNAQYTYSANVVAASYQISPALRAVAIGTAAETVNQAPTYCHDAHVESVYYFFHWSCASGFGIVQSMTGYFFFPIQVSGVRGTAEIDWMFRYTTADNPCTPGVPC